MSNEYDNFFKNMNKTLETMNRVALPVQKIQQSISPIIHAQKMVATRIASEMNPIFNVINSLQPIFQRVGQQLEKLPQRTQKAIMILANEGWFIESETPLELLFKTEHKTIEEVENLFVLHYEDNLDSIEKKLIQKFPSRALILKKAFYAHREEMYELSIPIFLIQSDGICLDLTQCHYFHQQYKLNQYIESNLSDTFTDEFLKPLKEKIPLSQNEKERGENFNKLNRHTILHGECTNYSNKTNSLKAISFMAYLLEFLEKVEEKNDNSLDSVSSTE